MINGVLIKQKRQELGLSQTQLAALCGYTDKSVICHLEKGDIKDIPLSKAIIIAKQLQINPTDLAK